MKRLIIAVAAVALTASLYAADTKPVADAKDKGSCCDKAKAGGCCAESTKSACSKTPSKGVAMSPKAMALAAH